MSEPLPSTPVPHEPLAYQPISGWAISGFAVGALFALLVVSSAVVALFQGVPVFFPIWVLGFAIVGFVLSLAGQRHVQNSEGTRAGAKLARIGLWLSLISGLCYFSYYMFTGIALEAQANAFLMEMGEDSGFFPRLQESASKPVQLNAVFLLTRPATARAGRPEDERSMLRNYDEPSKDGGPGQLSQFKESLFPRLFSGQLGKDAEVIPLAVQEWGYEKRSYKIRRGYRIKTKELEMELAITVQSTEAESAGQTRKWFLNLNETYPMAKNFTLLGKGVGILRMSSQARLLQWGQEINAGLPVDAFKDKDETAWDQARVKKEELEAVKQGIRASLAGTGGKNRLFSFAVQAKADDVGKWEQVDGKIRFHHPFRFGLLSDPGNQPMGTVDGVMVIETRKAIDPFHVDETTPPPEWTVVRYVVTGLLPVQDRKGPP